MTIVIGLVVIALSLIAAIVIAVANKFDTAAIAGALGVATAVGTIIGALATALNAPTGIGKVISSALNAPPNSGQEETTQ